MASKQNSPWRPPSFRRKLITSFACGFIAACVCRLCRDFFGLKVKELGPLIFNLSTDYPYRCFLLVCAGVGIFVGCMVFKLLGYLKAPDQNDRPEIDVFPLNILASEGIGGSYVPREFRFYAHNIGTAPAKSVRVIVQPNWTTEVKELEWTWVEAGGPVGPRRLEFRAKGFLETMSEVGNCLITIRTKYWGRYGPAYEREWTQQYDGPERDWIIMS